MPKVILYIFGCAALFFFTWTSVEANPVVVELPVAIGGYDIKKYKNNQKNIKEFSYKINVEYPASSLIDFYKKQFAGNGWELGKDKISWECFIDGTLPNSPAIKQFSISWGNEKLLAKHILFLKYVKVNDKWTDELNVSSKLHPLFSSSEEKHFFSRLETSGNFNPFMDILNSYIGKNNKIDTKLMLKENFSNPFVVEYVKILDSQEMIIKKSKLLYK